MAKKRSKGDLADIRLSGDKVLETPCEPIEAIDDDIRALAQQMLDDMYAAEGCGLAAPQVGRSIRLVVVDCDWGGGRKRNPYVLVNPRIVEKSEETRVSGEGCLSFPGVTVEVERPRRVVVLAEDLDGQTLRYEAADSLMAVCLQHEIDHLDGVTMVDHLGPLARTRTLAEVDRAIAAGAQPGETD